jgi:hypothetical protein
LPTLTVSAQEGQIPSARRPTKPPSANNMHQWRRGL